MTAEVLVMNTSAVAMAADTAVSIPYRGGTKTYTRARKLLPMHESEPIAVMVSDAPDHFTLPWEVIVGEFQRSKVRRSFSISITMLKRFHLCGQRGCAVDLG